MGAMPQPASAEFPMSGAHWAAILRKMARSSDAEIAAGAITVVLGEDNYIASEGIARVIERADGVELLAACDDLDSLRAAVERQQPDVVLTDIRMPPTKTDEGIRLARELQASHPDIGVVVVSQHSDPAYATALLEEGSGRRAYLLKERITGAKALADIVRLVAEGGSYIDPLIVEMLLRSNKARQRSRLDMLTPRELEILALIAEGRSNLSIAEALVLTKRAVERHINGIFMKLKLGNPEDTSRRVQAALIYLKGDTG
jgi:DNA-binding NarL/FixJ family response regulator